MNTYILLTISSLVSGGGRMSVRFRDSAHCIGVGEVGDDELFLLICPALSEGTFSLWSELVDLA